MFSGKLGVHWIVDAYDCRAPQLADIAHLEAVLTTIPDQLGLERIGTVRTFQREETVAGIALISESHFSIHVRPDHRMIHADLFSCRPFDMARALELLKTAYDFVRYEEQVLERGRMK